MFNKNVFTQKDPIADLIKPMLEAQTKAKMEELKGNQGVLDKNKNNKLDAQDFKILRGEKKAVKEDAEQVEEGLKDIAKKAVKALTGGSDEDQLKNLQKKMGVPQTGKKPVKEEEELEESSPFDWKKPREPEVKGGSGVKAGRAYGGAAQKSKPEQDDADDKKKVKEEVEQIDELSLNTMKSAKEKLGHKAYDAHMDDNKYAARHYASRALNMANKIKKKERQVTKEEVEQVDELSRKTMKSYMKKAEPDAVQSVAAAHDKVEKYIDKTGKAPSSPKHVMKIAGNEIMRAAKRTKGIERATTKLAKEEVEQVDERTLTKGETAERERIVKGMKKGLAGFKARYGDRAKSVMYATATKAAKKD